MKTKRTSKRQAKTNGNNGAAGLLAIAARLKDQVMKAGAGPSLREKTEAILMNVDNDDHAARYNAHIRVIQIQRDAGAWDADEATAVIAYMANRTAEHAYFEDAELERINAAVNAANKAHGLDDDEDFTVEGAPEDVKELWAAWDRRARAIEVTVLRSHGENALADLLLTDENAFRALVQQGNDFLLPKGTTGS